MGGERLIDTLILLTGLPEDYSRCELNMLLESKKINSSELDLCTLREILAEFMQDVLLEAKSKSQGELSL